MRKWLFTAVMLVLTLGVCWGAADLTYRLLQERIEKQITRTEGITSLTPISLKKLDEIIKSSGTYKEYHRLDPVQGWSIRENAEGELYSSNSIGIRGKREYALEKPADVDYRIAAFGDSFTHCDDVANEYTWEHVMEQKDTDIEVMNFGVGGYGTDQAYIRYQRKGKPYHADIVLIGFMVENINRNVNAFVPFYRRLSSPLTKPRFSLDDDGELVLRESKLKTRDDYIALREHQREYLKKLGEYDYYYQRLYLSDWDYKPFKLAYYIAVNITDPWVVDYHRQYNTSSEPYKVTLKIIEDFYKEAEADGSKPWVVVFPEMEDVMRARRGKVKRHQPLLDAFDERDMRYVDILDGFERNDMLSIGKLFHGHYTEAGDALVAKILLNRLGLEK